MQNDRVLRYPLNRFPFFRKRKNAQRNNGKRTTHIFRGGVAVEWR